MNQSVLSKLKWMEQQKIKEKQENVVKSLGVLEKDAEEVLIEDVTVIMGKDMLNKLKEVFDSCKERGQEHIDEVETSELIASIAEDQYFESYY